MNATRRPACRDGSTERSRYSVAAAVRRRTQSRKIRRVTAAATKNGLLFHDPDVAVKHGIAMALKLEGAAGGAFGFAAAGLVFDFVFVVDGHAVVFDSDDCRFGFLAVGIKFGGGKI